LRLAVCSDCRAQPDRVLAKPFDVAALQRVLGEQFPR
jgi:hypothetical protein